MRIYASLACLSIVCSFSFAGQGNPVPQAQALCSISFERDAKRPSRVDNEAKACLDDVALNLQRTSDARVVVIGHSATSEKGTEASQRAVNVKGYLVTEKGIDQVRIELRAGGSVQGKIVTIYLIPGGAVLKSEPDAKPVEVSIKPQRKYETDY